MLSRKLTIFLSQLSHSQRKMEYCRQILFEAINKTIKNNQNENDIHHQIQKHRYTSSLITLFQQIDLQKLGKFTFSDLKDFIQRQRLSYKQKQNQAIFHFFDFQKENAVRAKTFCDIMKPIKFITDTQNNGMKQYKEHNKSCAAIQGDCFTFQVEYAFKRLLNQVVQNEKQTHFIRTQLISLIDQNEAQQRSSFTESERYKNTIKVFMNSNHKYPDQRSISLIYRGLQSIKNQLSMSKLFQFMHCQVKKQVKKQVKIQNQAYGVQKQIPKQVSKQAAKQSIQNKKQQTYRNQLKIQVTKLESIASENNQRRLSTINEEEVRSITAQQQQNEQIKLITFSSSKDFFEDKGKIQNYRQFQEDYTEIYDQKQTPYKLLLSQRSQHKKSHTGQHLKSTPVKKSEAIYKPKKQLKNASGKENRVQMDKTKATLTPLKNEQIKIVLSKIQGLRDVTNHICNRF